MTYEQITALYSLFITNINNLIGRFGKAYFPNPHIKNISAYDDLEDILTNFENFLSVEDYKKHEGFLFPIILLDCGNSKFKIIDGCHRYAYTRKYPESIILAVPLKDNVGSYEMLIPTELCGDSCTKLYSFSMRGIPCVKVIIPDLISFRSIYVAFTDLIYKEMKKNDEYFFKASSIVNLNIKVVNNNSQTGIGFDPSYQYLDEYGIIKHETMNTNYSKQYIQSLYNLYLDNLETVYGDDLFYMNRNNIGDIEISNIEWWNHIYFTKDSLVDNIRKNGIFFPMVYRYVENGIYTIADGLHRFFACKKILQESESFGKYLLIPDHVITDIPKRLYIPKEIYDRYSYMLKAEIQSYTEYENIIDSYIISTTDSKTISNIRLLVDRELNDMYDKGLFTAFGIRSAKLLNGGVI